MIELTSSWLNNLKNADHVGVTTQIYEVVKKSEIDTDAFRAAKEALAKAIADEDEAYKKTLKDWVVEELKTTDNNMDNYMTCIRSMLTGQAALPDTEPEKQKAKQLLQLWKEYAFSTADSYSGESAKVLNMHQEAEKSKADAEALHVWTYFDKAKAEAEKVQKLLGERLEGLATRELGEMRKARTATDAVIKQLYGMIGALQKFTPDEALTELAKRLRAIEDYARVYYLKGSASGADDTPTETPDEGSGDGGTVAPPDDEEDDRPPFGGD